MNRTHLDYLASADWEARLERDLIPWLERTLASRGRGLGDDVLEVGPGPGLTTDILRRRAGHVTAVEVDSHLATSLATRLAGRNVEVHAGDAADLPFGAGRFSCATCFSVMHHVSTPEHQDRVLAEILRVLEPGATLFVTDARDTQLIRDAHDDDVFVPMPLDTLEQRLADVGFAEVAIEVADYELRVSATKPFEGAVAHTQMIRA